MMSQPNFPAIKTNPLRFSIDWKKVGQIMLKYFLPINPMSTQPDDMGKDGKDLLIHLDHIQTSNNSNTYSKHSQNPSSQGKFRESKQINLNDYSLELLFKQICDLDTNLKYRRKVAIVGESGTGKSLCLQTFAHWMLQETDYIPIWVSPEQLTNITLKDYLTEKWLSQCSKHYGKNQKLSQEFWRTSFEALLKSGKVWLLGDGIDHLLAKSRDNYNDSPLTVFVRQQESLGNSHLILTCQNVTWKMQGQALDNFDIYQAKSLSNLNEIQQFVEKWLHPHTSNQEKSGFESDLGKKLFSCLIQPENRHLQTWLKNPLRLSLLCRFWQRNPQNLPATSATFYQILVSEFYQWQAENTDIAPTEQQPLNRFLTQLAFNHRNTVESFVPISQRKIEDNQDLLSLSLQLHWLRPVGVVNDPEEHNQYRFEDQTFEDYFAALAIENWQYFLQKETTSIEIFSDQWQRILLFWLGREDILPAEKEALIKALVSFKDECYEENFYGFRAYLLAATALSEFQDCSLKDTIIEQLLTWAFKEQDLEKSRRFVARETINKVHRPLVVTHLINHYQNSPKKSQKKQRLDFLEKFGKKNQQAIAALTEFLENTQENDLRWQLAETLGTIDPGNSTAITLIVQGLETATDEQDYQKAFLALEKIAQGQGQGVKALVRLLHRQPSPNLRRRTFQCLEIIGRGNATAIAILVQLIRTTNDETIRRQAAESLEKIDQGNPTAIAVLVKLMKTTTNASIRQEVVYSLGEVCLGNNQAIAALVSLLEENDDIYLRWMAISSLGKIGIQNKQTIGILEKLIQPDEPSLIRKEALDSLGKIDPSNPLIVKVSMQLMEEVSEEETYREIAENLGKISPSNSACINVLSRSLQTSTDEFVLRQLAVSLGKVDPGNLEALMVLVNLVQSTNDPDLRSLAAESLGEIGQGNPAAIATLIRVLETSSHRENCRCATKSLSKIAVNNKGAIATFLRILPTIKDQGLGKQIAEGLIKIVPEKQMAQVVSQLREHLVKQSLPKDSPCYQVMWHCSQHLPYHTFKKAWQKRNLPQERSLTSQTSQTPETETTKNLPLFEKLQQQIKNTPELGSSQIIWIESCRFIDSENPAVDIYDQMLEQDCPVFDHGLPETLSKLRLYWHLLQQKLTKSNLILLFYDQENSRLSSHLLESLAKFRGIVAAITQQESSELSVFSPDDPQLDQTLINWLKQKLQ